ncbi:MAG: XRE family transcriptional regulator [Pseudolabrys sp.]|nr:XRE family transcriptional regulator [Pseudolabrys sp.]
MTERFDSVWDALENSPAEAANMKARSGLMIAIRDAVDGWNLTQAEAAKRLGVTQPRMNDLLRGRIDKFSLDALMILATDAGLTVEWRVGKRVA